MFLAGRIVHRQTCRVTTGTVRFWLDDEGWGVIDCAETPGGCWAHFSCVEMEGFRTRMAGQQVNLDWAPAQQDGFAYQAVSVAPIA